jgi:hypothetical protein
MAAGWIFLFVCVFMRYGGFDQEINDVPSPKEIFHLLSETLTIFPNSMILLEFLLWQDVLSSKLGLDCGGLGFEPCI